jgi:Asp-tRNA(Asn)/Glu-tRNA(Gln) amidotransferase A subunit family amidase
MTGSPGPPTLAELDAVGIAEAVRSRRLTARDAVEAALGRIAARDGALNSFTAVLADAARRDADAVDTRVARGEDPGLLAGVPFAVKNLFDVKGLTTLAGSRIHAERPPAARDAAAVAALRRAGAVLVGTLNMDEYAFGFTTENSHYGATRNPHDRERVAGGSSGGSGAAVGAGMVPLALGSDTNGSIRVPAALCGYSGSSRPMAVSRGPAPPSLRGASITWDRCRARPGISRRRSTRSRARMPRTPWRAVAPPSPAAGSSRAGSRGFASRWPTGISRAAASRRRLPR